MTSQFHEFDGDKLTPIPEGHVVIPSRRMSDQNLEIIAHKISRLASEFSDYKSENARSLERMEQSMRWTHASLTEATSRAAEAAETAKESVKEIVADAMSNAFPDGDSAGHREAHEAWIRKVEESAKFWKQMREDLVKYGLIGFLGFAAIALWNGFLKGPPQ